MTTEQTQTHNMFAAPPVREIPPKYCVGYVTEIGEAKVTGGGTGNYVRLSFKIAPLEAGQASQSGFMWAPGWLTPGFDPSELQRGPGFVYQNNIQAEEDSFERIIKAPKVSILRGLAGSDERFYELGTALSGLKPDDVDGVEKTIKDFVLPGGEAIRDAEGDPKYVIGYRLVQQSEKGEDGKKKLKNGYQLDSIFWPTDAAIAALQKHAEENGDIILGF